MENVNNQSKKMIPMGVYLTVLVNDHLKEMNELAKPQSSDNYEMDSEYPLLPPDYNERKNQATLA